MAKKVSIFLVALMVLTLFTAVAIAAVNVECCPECGGDVSVSYSSPYGDSSAGSTPCKYVKTETDERRVYYIDCYEVCSGCSESVTTTTAYYYTVCDHVK